jgi:hypothetical protein
MNSHTFRVFSQNLRGKYEPFIDSFNFLLQHEISPVIFIQDLGFVGPDAPQDLVDGLAPHTVIVNANPERKSRNTGIIIHKDWEIQGEIKKHESGGLIGVTIRKGSDKILAMSAYLPWGLDYCGVPKQFNAFTEKGKFRKQEEALEIYATAEQDSGK